MHKDNKLAGLLPFITEQLVSLNPRKLPRAIHPLKILRYWRRQASFKQADLPAAKHAIPLSAVAAKPQKLTGSNWEAIYEQLKNAIKVRHYSNKTWQAYRYCHQL